MAHPITNIGATTTKRCILCNEAILTEIYDVVKEEGLATVKEFSARWGGLDSEVCQGSPYKEFHLSEHRLAGIL